MALGPPLKRFKQISSSDIKDKGNLYKNSNTKANEKKATKNFQLFLEFNQQDKDFFNYTEPQLDEWLGKFYLGTRTEKGEYYTSGSLHTLRYGINRALQDFGHKFDITDRKYTSFVNSNKAFDLALKEIKNAGKGHRKSTPEISSAYLNKIYNSKFLDPDNNVRSLQAKVKWDIRYYFARRGGENIPEMTKSTFKLSTDPVTGIKFIERAQDEETKNHKEVDSDIITAFMPEMGTDNPKCPVTSFLTYLYSLSKESESLWQSPKFTRFPKDPCNRVYYGPQDVSHNTHEKFVSRIAKNCGLEEFKYTNHSLRVTAITTLTRDNFTNKQIMSITGHKSSSSLETYQRVSSSEKIAMGRSLGSSLLTNKELVPYISRKDDKNTEKIDQNDQNEPLTALLPLQSNIEDPADTTDMQFNMSDEEIMNIIQQAKSENQDILLSQQKKITTYDGKNKQVVSTNTPLPGLYFQW